MRSPDGDPSYGKGGGALEPRTGRRSNCKRVSFPTDTLHQRDCMKDWILFSVNIVSPWVRNHPHQMPMGQDEGWDRAGDAARYSNERRHHLLFVAVG